ncbi:aldo/keto reductase [Janibacter indicus]|uniref:aldo/keto reductase n=1 Tax=Janibacter indicus TaxID=857417 RepID=UPI003EBEC378
MDVDTVVVLSGVVELALGVALLVAWRHPCRAVVGIVAAGLFVAVFPGNIAQLTEHRDAFDLDTDRGRVIRLFFQPVLIAWALWATDAVGARRRGACPGGIVPPPLDADVDMTVPTLALNDATTIPQLGFGVFQIPPESTKEAVLTALRAGYRHIDTAQMYGNEQGVGEAIAESGIPREELFVTTKLNNNNHDPADVKRSLRESLDRLGLDRVDLFLIHWPLPTVGDGDFVATWRAMVEAREEGLTTSVGVSNFQPDHLDRIVAETGEVPAVNQIEVHPYFTNDAAREATRRHGAQVEAWSPIAQGAVLDDPVLVGIAGDVERTVAQVVLRWHIQRGDIVFPKSVTPSRIEANFALFDFALSEDQMAAISALDTGDEGRRGPHPDVMDIVPD